MLKLTLICAVCILTLIIIYIWWWKSVIKGLPMLKPVFPWGHVWYLDRKKNIPNHSLLSYLYNFILGNLWYFNGGMFYFRLFIFNYVFLTSPEYAQVMFMNSTEFSKADVYAQMKWDIGEGLITLNDQVLYKAHRKVISKTFSKNMLEKFQTVFSRNASILCEILFSKNKDMPINISKLIPLCTYDIIFETLSGKNIQAQKYPMLDIIKVTNELEEKFIERIISVWRTNTVIKSLVPSEILLEKKREWFENFYREVVKNRLKLVAEEVMRISTGEEYRGCDDHPCLVDLLLQKHLQKDKFFSEEQVLHEVKTLMTAAFDTTSATLKWMFFLIGNFPDVQRKIHEELDQIFGLDCDREITTNDLNLLNYLTMVMKETQRLHPAIPIIGRKILKDMKIGDQLIPGGTQIAVIIGAIHRDPRHFENPEEFIPERFSPENSTNRHPFAFIPFSAGQRNCPGSTFAMRSILTITASVLRKFSIKSVLRRDKIGTHWAVTGNPNQDIELLFRQRK